MMYHLKALIAAHRAKLAVAGLGYALYSAIDPASSTHAGFAVAAVILMGLFVFVPAMLLAAHVDRVKPGKVEKPFKPSSVRVRVSTPVTAGVTGSALLSDTTANRRGDDLFNIYYDPNYCFLDGNIYHK